MRKHLNPRTDPIHDPADAPLDPDGDHVTNLRESQIQTNPTGVYRVELRHTDTTSTYEPFVAADDTGRLIVKSIGQATIDDGYGPITANTEEFTLLPSTSDPTGVSVVLPRGLHSARYDDNYYEYYLIDDIPSYKLDSSQGRVNGTMHRNRIGYFDGEYIWSEDYNLIPDAASNFDQSTWTPLNGYTDWLSTFGTRRIKTWDEMSYDRRLIDEAGHIIGSDPLDWEWQVVNNSGDLAGLKSIAGSTFLQMESGLDTVTVPVFSGWSGTIENFSDDCRLLIRTPVRNPDGTNRYEFQVGNMTTGLVSPVRQPAAASNAVLSQSDRNGHILAAAGEKSFQITPDGTCIRLAALRVRPSSGGTPVPLATLYPGALAPNHIASGGRITLTTTNTAGQKIILQVTPDNDGNANGLFDDWEQDTANRLLAAGILVSLPIDQYGNIALTAQNDYDGDGQDALTEQLAGTSDGDLDDFNEAAVYYPNVFLRNRITAGATKAPFFVEFDATCPGDPTPLIKYYMKKVEVSTGESNSSHPTHFDWMHTSTTIKDRTTFLGVEENIDEVNNDSGTYVPSFDSGAWQQQTYSDSHVTTKTTDITQSHGTYRIPSNGLTGDEDYMATKTLSLEYDTQMMIEDGDTKFSEPPTDQSPSQWQNWGRNIAAESYTTRDEVTYHREGLEFAIEPPFRPDISKLRIAWLEINRADLERGIIPGISDSEEAQAIVLHQKYYSGAQLWNFFRVPGMPISPHAEIRRLDPSLNHESLIYPLQCDISLNAIGGPIVVETIPDWESPDIGQLTVDFRHSTGGGTFHYGDVIGDEFDVPIKVEILEGQDKIRVAKATYSPAGETFTPVTLPIADFDYLERYVFETLKPGKVILRASCTTKHGLRVSTRASMDISLPHVSLSVASRGIGGMVKSVSESKPDNYVTPKMTTEHPESKVVVVAVSQGMTPAFFQKFYEWDNTTLSGTVDPYNPLKFEVSRASPIKTEVRLIEKGTNKNLASMQIWVVWSHPVNPYQEGQTKLGEYVGDMTNGGVATSSTQFSTDPRKIWKFTFAIQPSEVISDSLNGLDSPLLYENLAADVLVPGGAGAHPVLGFSPEGQGGKFIYGANHYWDVSRQMKITIKNPGLIPWSNFSYDQNDLDATQQPAAQAISVPIQFPTDPVMGNDDVGREDHVAVDEDNYPYLKCNKFLLKHEIGQVTSVDMPNSYISNVAGTENMEYEELDHFREFVRLKLPPHPDNENSGWFRVSDYVDWKFEMKLKFVAGKWQDNGSLPVPTP